jgi:hypothetical protein
MFAVGNAAHQEAAEIRRRGRNCALESWTFIVAPLHSAQQKMRGRGRAVGFLAAKANRVLWRLAAALTVVLLSGFTCVTTAQNNNTPSPTPSPTPTPAPSPTQASTPASITGIPMAAGEVGVSYTASLSATGGPSPYTWSLDSGTMPGGLTLGTDGGVSGVPTTPGTFSFTVKASDATNQYTTEGATIKVAAHLALALVPGCAQSCAVEQGCVNVCGTFGTQTGGVGPFTYQATGNIPGGMKISGLSLAGSFPNLAQFWQFTVTVTDALGATGSLSPIFYVYPHISLASGVCSGNYNTGCSVQLKISGGTPNGRPSVKLVAVGQNPNQGCWQPSATAPPSGYTLTAGGGYVTGNIPARLINGYGAVWTLVVTDQSLCGPGSYCTSRNATVTIGVQCG